VYHRQSSSISCWVKELTNVAVYNAPTIYLQADNCNNGADTYQDARQGAKEAGV